jgi:hypothetical protein
VRAAEGIDHIREHASPYPAPQAARPHPFDVKNP